MSHRIFGTSVRGWRNILLWTVAGTLGCIAFSVLFNTIVFSDQSDEARLLGVKVAVILPTLLAGPLFFYLTLKMRELARVNHRLNTLAREDGLTGLLNRSALIDAVRQHALQRLEAGTAQSDLFVVVDADHFKVINDNHGHAEGDAALRLIAGALRDSVRENDIVGRVGGEEFAILLKKVDHANAEYITDRLRRAVASIPFRPGGERHDLSVSIGGILTSDTLSFADLFKAADANLYEAKARGRNCSVITQYGLHFAPMVRAADASTASRRANDMRTPQPAISTT